MDQPAVMDLNMRAASGGMLLIRHILQPFLREPLPVSFSENFVTFRTIAATKARKHDPLCPVCQQNPNFGYGDCGPRIGFDKETVRHLMGTDADAGAEPSPSISAHKPARAWWQRAVHWIRSRVNPR